MCLHVSNTANAGSLIYQESNGKAGTRRIEAILNTGGGSCRYAYHTVDKVGYFSKGPPPPKASPKHPPKDPQSLLTSIKYLSSTIAAEVLATYLHLIWLLSLPSIDPRSTFIDDALVLSLELRVDVLARANVHWR